MNFKIIILTAIMLPLCLQASAQPDRKEVRKGNRDFKKERYKEAEIDYRKALVKDSTSFAANYNLASVLYKNNDFEQAIRHLDTLSKTADVSEYASDYYYNRGNCAVQQKDWQKAVDSYKKSLIRNPDDLDAKENYIYAKEMLKQQQQQQQNNKNQDNKNNQDNDSDQNKDQNKDNQDKNQNQDQNKDQNKDDQNQNKPDKNEQDRKDGRQNRQSPKISPQAAQQMLKAIQAKEKETQEKVKKEKAAALESSQKEKNW